MRLAVVSSDGKNVDLHLGRGKSVYVYDYDGELSFKEKRDIEIAEDANIKLVMDEGPVDEVLERYINHVEFMKR